MIKSVHVALLAASLIASMASPVPAQSPRQGARIQNFDYVEVATPEHVSKNIYNVVGAVIVNMGFSVGVGGILMVDSDF